MKKLLSLLGVLIIIGCLQANAETSGVYMDFYKYGHEGKNTTVHRSPMRIPIDVYYDDELRQIEISGSTDIDVQIYLCDENGNIIAYSSITNTTLDIPEGYNGRLSISIECDNWVAIGCITI